MPLCEYIYVFGYESPTEAKLNDSAGTDYESSGVFRIVAENEEEALQWGEELSEWYVRLLFGDTRKSWKSENFARWVERTPDDALRAAAAKIEPVSVGTYPDFTLVRSALAR